MVEYKCTLCGVKVSVSVGISPENSRNCRKHLVQEHDLHASPRKYFGWC